MEPNGQQEEKGQGKRKIGRIMLWLPYISDSIQLQLARSILVMIAFVFFLVPMFSQFVSLNEAKLLALGVPLSIFALSTINIVYKVIYVDGKPIAEGINVGGAIIPVAISAYLMWELRAWIVKILIILLIAIFFAWLFSIPKERGIMSIPLIEPLSVVITSVALFRGEIYLVPAVAYSTSVVGSLIGGDVLKYREAMPLVKNDTSIGGHGIIDKINIDGLHALAISYFLILLSSLRL